jgi:hypothetical protein
MKRISAWLGAGKNSSMSEKSEKSCSTSEKCDEPWMEEKSSFSVATLNVHMWEDAKNEDNVQRIVQLVKVYFKFVLYNVLANTVHWFISNLYGTMYWLISNLIDTMYWLISNWHDAV